MIKSRVRSKSRAPALSPFTRPTRRRRRRRSLRFFHQRIPGRISWVPILRRRKLPGVSRDASCLLTLSYPLHICLQHIPRQSVCLSCICNRRVGHCSKSSLTRSAQPWVHARWSGLRPLASYRSICASAGRKDTISMWPFAVATWSAVPPPLASALAYGSGTSSPQASPCGAPVCSIG